MPKSNSLEDVREIHDELWQLLGPNRERVGVASASSTNSGTINSEGRAALAVSQRLVLDLAKVREAVRLSIEPAEVRERGLP
jgi:hypothetical protein